MAPSTFHRQFRAVTSLSPVQYQKRLRLHEAQRLMLVESLGVEAAARRVGYESCSQFSREYKRLFGDAPRQGHQGEVGRRLRRREMRLHNGGLRHASQD